MFPSPKRNVKFSTIFHYHGFSVTFFTFYSCNMYQTYNGITAYPFKTPL